MKTRHLWNGVRMRNLHTAIDPDAPLYSVTIPEKWDDNAATAILQLCPDYLLDNLPIQSDMLIANWLLPLCEHGNDHLRHDWEELLLYQQACPNISIWKKDSTKKPGITINLAAFSSTESGFNAKAYRHVLQVVVDSLRLIHQQQSHYINNELPLFDTTTQSSTTVTDDLEHILPVAGTIYLSNLDACLAQLGHDYDSINGRDIACCITCFATLFANAGCGAELLPLSPDWNALPELSATAKEIWSLASDNNHPNLARIETSFSFFGNEADILLGSEACGLAPIFSPLREDGLLALSAIARLAHKGLTLETALAASLAGEQVIALPSQRAHYAMHQALTGFVTNMPQRPNPITQPLSTKAILPRGTKRHLPPRHKGITQKASIAGRALFLRTGEYEDGTLGEISITPTKESAMVKGLLASVSQAISIGLQYGVPLQEYVSTFAYSQFGIAGTVEGDPGTTYATSFLDYSFRALSDIYLNKSLPDAPNNLHSGDETIPMLPLELPENDEPLPSSPHSKNRKLKLVS